MRICPSWFDAISRARVEQLSRTQRSERLELSHREFHILRTPFALRILVLAISGGQPQSSSSLQCAHS